MGWKELRAEIEKIKPIDRRLLEEAARHLERQTRPRRSLGYLENLVARVVAIQENLKPSIEKKVIFILAGDHGVTEEGVSLYPEEVTAQMVYNFLAGGATINALSKDTRAEVKVVDIGVNHTFANLPGLIQRKVRPGTRNFAKESAMTEAEALQAIQIGIDLARRAKREGFEIIGTGEMGIGNTTSASAIVAALTGEMASKVTGRGTGIDDAMLSRKVSVIERALSTHRDSLGDPVKVLQAFGGLEIAGITGIVLGAAFERIPCVIDGVIASAGAAVAVELNRNVLDYLFFGHRSFEPAHEVLLRRYEARPVLDLDMRLGEGTGACLAMMILRAMVRVFNEVATFEEAKVAQAKIKVESRQ